MILITNAKTPYNLDEDTREQVSRGLRQGGFVLEVVGVGFRVDKDDETLFLVRPWPVEVGPVLCARAAVLSVGWVCVRRARTRGSTGSSTTFATTAAAGCSLPPP